MFILYFRAANVRVNMLFCTFILIVILSDLNSINNGVVDAEIINLLRVRYSIFDTLRHEASDLFEI